MSRWRYSPHYLGQFRVPPWLYHLAPDWVHRWADKLGGVE